MSRRRSFVVSLCTSCALLFLTTGLSAGTNLLKPAQTFPSGSAGSSAIAVADVNGDGKPDIILGNGANDSSGSVGVLLGNGDGTFQAAQNYSTAGHTITSVAVADLNGDGKPDVVVSQTEGIAVLLGNGDGTFQAAKAYAIDSLSGTSQVVVADVNHDGKPDLLTALVCNPGFQDCNHGGAAGVMLGNGDGTFGTLQAYASGDSFATSIAISDLNRDGNLDLVIDNATSTYNRGFVGILLGNGDGTFQAHPRSTTRPDSMGARLQWRI